MHLIEPEAGVMGTSAVVGPTIPQAVGYAYALKMKKSKAMVVSFFGDGAVEEGVFHESLNFASLKQLPIIFVCENNLYAIHSHQNDRQPNNRICDRVETFGIPAKRVDSSNIKNLYELVKSSVDDIKRGDSGPVFFECMCYRWMEHVGPGVDFGSGYRSVAEAQPWYEDDQIKHVGSLLDSDIQKEIEREVDREIEEAFLFADQSEFPDASELHADLFEGE